MVPEDFDGFIRLADLAIDPGIIKFLPVEVMDKNAVIPLWMENDQLVVACTDPTNEQMLREVAIAARRPIIPILASITDIRLKIYQIQPKIPKATPMPDLGELLYLLGHLSESDLQKVRQARLTGETDWRFITDNKLVGEEGMTESVGWLLGKPYLTRRTLSTEPCLLPLLPWDLATEQKIIPLWWFNGILILGKSALTTENQSESLTSRVGFPIWTVITSPSTWNSYYRKTYLHGVTQQVDEPNAIIQILSDSGRLSDLDRASIELVLQQTGLPLEEILLKRGLVTRNDWLDARAQYYEVALNKIEREAGLSDQELSQLIPAMIARSFTAVPLRRNNGKVVVGMYKPVPEIVGLIENLTGLDIEPEMMDTTDIEERIRYIYPNMPRSGVNQLPGFDEFLNLIGYITHRELDEVLSDDFPTGFHIGDCLVSKGYLSDLDIAQALSLYTGLPFARLDYAHFEKKHIDQLPAHVARKCNVIPLWSNEEDMWVAVANPLDGKRLRIVEQASGLRIWPLIAPRSVITAAVNRFYGDELRKVDARIIHLIEGLVENGILTQTGASKALQDYSENQVYLDQAIAKASHYTEYEILQAVAEVIGATPISLQLYETEATVIDPLGNIKSNSITRDPVNVDTANSIDAKTAYKLSALPVDKDGAQIVVAFANPEYHADLEEMQSILGEKVSPRLVGRADLEEAIHRTLEHGNIGSRLLLAGIITRKQLNDALDLAKRTGVRLGRALVNRRYISQTQLSQFLAEQAGIPFGTLEGIEFDQDVVNQVSADEARAYGILPIRVNHSQVFVAVVDPLDDEAMRFAEERFNKEILPVLVTEQELEAAFERLYSGEYLARSVSELLERYPEDSAYRVLGKGQKVGLSLFLILSIVWVYFDYRSYFIAINILATLFYLLFSGYRFYLVYKAISRDLEIPVSDEEISALDDRDLPVYTILIPVYKEAEVLVSLLDAVRDMDYPPTKLDIKVLMEADDEETIQTFRDWNAPSHFEGIVVPYAQPKTKPKACNYGLIHARGEYVVIYDAEDKPDSDQLKRIMVAFSKAPPEVVCVQAKLNYYNRHQNLLTRWFTVEYSMWFDLFLPGLDASNAPIPLGGTSNHFKRDALVEAGAWDPYNVTEDADLGIRIHKRGYRTAVVDTTTYEEANSHVYNWIRQRSRWIKGYIQTWLVHMRNPGKLINSIGIKSFLSFQFVVGGTFFSALVNPIYWILTTLWFFFKWDFIQQIFPGIIFYFGAICLFVGNFAFTYMNVAGAMRRGYHDMVKHALLSPLYWGLASVAAWRGFSQLITKPYFWEKTIHGLYEPRIEPEVGNIIDE